MQNKERNRIIANNIKKYLKQNNMSQKELSNKISISPSTLSDYLNLRSNPSHGVIQKISDVFGILKSDIDTTYKETNEINDIYNKLSNERKKYVLSYAEHQYKEQESTVNEDTFNVTNIYNHKKENIETEENVIPFPIYGATGAGLGEEIYDDVLYEEINININDLPKDAEFGILVNGDSMEPMFDKGSYAFVSKQTQVFNNTIALVVLNNAALIKKVVFNDKTVKLVSINPYYDDIYVRDNDNFRVVGRIVI
ncbi:XRE family transcriptional regulator [Staphylococcus xylosus]|uniref:XRE family transcriptional regulator n=2 Tax=Staphylococcus TaxID=1279 RepID=UPI002DBF81C1|nr:XRE family transcriptional regulator [Staphylococcus xylosus]MEB6240166.1 XRE family transcriptional regulator [Staphylococcus xylosus]